MKRYTPVPLSFICVQPETKCNDGPPIIYLHGVTGAKREWQNIQQEVSNATGRKAYLVDARNHGDTEWCDEYDYDCNMYDLLHFMDYIGAPKVTLVGHSMGGKTAMKTAMRAPERVDKVVIEDMYVRKAPKLMLDGVLTYIEGLKEAMELVPLDADETTAQKIIDDYAYAKLNKEYNTPMTNDPSVIPLKRKSDGRYYHTCNLDVIEKALRNPDTLMSECTGEYLGPAVFIYGENSPIPVREDKENIRKAFPNVEFVMIENASHEVHEAFPAEFTKALVDFLMR